MVFEHRSRTGDPPSSTIIVILSLNNRGGHGPLNARGTYVTFGRSNYIGNQNAYFVILKTDYKSTQEH